MLAFIYFNNRFQLWKENVGKRIGQFEAQLSETKVVQAELGKTILRVDSLRKYARVVIEIKLGHSYRLGTYSFL